MFLNAPRRIQAGAAAPSRRARLTWAIAALVAVVGCGGILATWVLSAPRPAFGEQAAAELETGGSAEKGRVIFLAGDCASCHASPGQPDRLRLGGGLALASPFGTFRVPNISPDPQDGIGRWRTIDLANALVSGVSPTGAHYYPAFPYPSYVHMTRADVKDLMAYLRTLAPVSGRAPAHELMTMFRIRRFVGLWKLMFLDTRRAEDDTIEAGGQRGRYLVETLGHCAECHSTRNLFGAIKPQTRFAGGMNPEMVGFAPNITPTRIGHWSRDDLVALLSSGRTPDGRVVGAAMNDVVINTARLPASDRIAIADYVKSLAARPTPRPP
jgi:mono/diheme cytochrome c family protein